MVFIQEPLSDSHSSAVVPSLPRVSIITVCFNSASTIRDTIESVLSQNYPNIEYIIVDGASRDGTLEIIEQYRDRIAAFVSEKDRGIYDAMNKGISLATGDVIGILNSDDVYADPGALECLMRLMLEKGSDSVFADLVYVDRSDLTKVRRYYDSSGWTCGRFRFGWMPAHPTFLIKRTWYSRYGLFSLEFGTASDYELLVRLLFRGGATYAYLQQPVIKMRIGGASTGSFKAIWRHNQQIVRACKANGMWTSLPLVLMKFPAKLIGLVRGRLFH